MEQGRPARCVELDPFKPTFLKRDAHSLCELQASQPRLEVGSNEAPRRQPTCHLVQVLIGSPRPERGFLKLCAVCAFFFSVPSQGKRTEFFCCYPSPTAPAAPAAVWRPRMARRSAPGAEPSRKPSLWRRLPPLWWAASKSRCPEPRASGPGRGHRDNRENSGQDVPPARCFCHPPGRCLDSPGGRGCFP